jgi:MinD superfamily P-loop ATPase
MEIAVISGKGGTGKSSISAAFSTLAKQVIVADCDVDAANLYLLFNPSHEEEIVFIGGYTATLNPEKCRNCSLCLDYCRFDAISWDQGVIAISPTACDGCFLCSRICPSEAITMVQNNKSRLYSGSFRNGKMVYGRLAPGEENSGKLVGMAREKAKQLASEGGFAFTILDGPPGIGCAVIATIMGVDKVIIVTEPSFSGLNDLKRTHALIQQTSLKAHVIINKFDLNHDLSRIIHQWCSEQGLPVIGEVPFDEQMVYAMLAGQTIIERDPSLAISKEINRIWNNINN